MERLNKLYKEQGMYALMLITYILQIGFDRAAEITDEEIEEVKANTSDRAVLSADFIEWCMKEARELVKEISPVQLCQWIQVNKPWDTKGIKKA